MTPLIDSHASLKIAALGRRTRDHPGCMGEQRVSATSPALRAPLQRREIKPRPFAFGDVGYGYRFEP